MGFSEAWLTCMMCDEDVCCFFLNRVVNKKQLIAPPPPPKKKAWASIPSPSFSLFSFSFSHQVQDRSDTNELVYCPIGSVVIYITISIIMYSWHHLFPVNISVTDDILMSLF